MTGIDLGVWVLVYFGIGLINASLPCPRLAGAGFDIRRMLAVPGYCLLVIGASVIGIHLLHHFH
jgi:hypothetical protein